jgi:hypothetical protein
MNKGTILGKALAAVVLSASAVGGVGGVAVVTAGTANAMPVETIRSECADAGGSFWATYGSGRVTGYYCGYRDISGEGWLDICMTGTETT